MKISSIRRFLIIGLLSAVAFVGCLMTFWSYQESRHEVEELFDAQQVQYARSLDRVVAVDMGQDGVITVPFQTLPEQWQGEEAGIFGHKYEAKLFFQVVTDNAQLLIQSESTPDFTLGSLAQGFRNVDVKGDQWRLFTLRDRPHQRWIIVAQKTDIRNELGQVIALQGIIPFAVTLPLAFVLIWWLVGKSLQPVRRLAKEVGRREANDLQAINLDGVARELMPLTNSVNSLLSRLSDAFSRERRFAGDAAHELRTPLAGMGIHLENALSSDGVEQKEALNMAKEGHRRMVHLVEQLLVLAKTTPESYVATFQQLNLNQICQQVIADNIQLALDKNQSISLDGDTEVLVHGDRTGLEILLSNLLRNAELYTPEGGSIRISASTKNDRSALIIADSGSGIPEDQRARVFDRFYRSGGDRHASDISGSGLGLSIVAHIVQLHKADIRLGESVEGGLEVKVLFP